MNSYNERLDEVLNWHTKCREEIKVASKGFTDDRWAEEQYRKIVHKHKTKAKQDITSLIKELVAEARIDELSQLLDEGEGGYPDGCEAVHLHSIEDRIAQLTQSNKEVLTAYENPTKTR